MSLDVQRIDAVCGRTAVVARLRQLLPRMEERGAAPVLPFGLAAIDGQLPQGGLALDAVHEFTGADEAGNTGGRRPGEARRRNGKAGP